MRGTPFENYRPLQGNCVISCTKKKCQESDQADIWVGSGPLKLHSVTINPENYGNQRRALNLCSAWSSTWEDILWGFKKFSVTSWVSWDLVTERLLIWRVPLTHHPIVKMTCSPFLYDIIIVMMSQCWQWCYCGNVGSAFHFVGEEGHRLQS